MPVAAAVGESANHMDGDSIDAVMDSDSKAEDSNDIYFRRQRRAKRLKVKLP